MRAIRSCCGRSASRSLAFYGPHSLHVDLPALNDIEQADSLARYELARRSVPRGRVTQLTLDARQHPAQVLARTLFDRVRVQESQTGHDSDYFIVAEAHTVDLGGSRHRVSWTLESAEANHFWLLGRDALNQTTVLAY